MAGIKEPTAFRRLVGLIGRLSVSMAVLLTVVTGIGATSAAAAGDKLKTPVVSVQSTATAHDTVRFDWNIPDRAEWFPTRITLNGQEISQVEFHKNKTYLNYTVWEAGTYCAYVTAKPHRTSTDPQSDESAGACVTVSPKALEAPAFRDTTTETTRSLKRLRLIWWSKVPGASKYKLEVTKDGNQWYSKTTAVPFARVPLSWKGVYCFTVTAVSTDPAFEDTSQESEEYCTTIYEKIDTPFLDLTGTPAQKVGETTRYSWEPISNADYYKVTIWRGDDMNDPGALIRRPTVTGTWLDHTFSTPGWYCVVMVAYPEDPYTGVLGYSDDSNNRCFVIS